MAPVERQATAKPQRRLWVHLSTPMYLVCWWIVLLIHLIAAIFVLGAALVHFMLSLPAIHRATSALLIPIALKRITSLAYLVVALLHLRAVVKMVYASLRNGAIAMQLAEGNASSGVAPRQGSASDLALLPSPSSSRTESVRITYSRAVKLWTAVFGPYGYLGIHGPLFSPSLLLREVVEVAMQSYQLYCLSYYVSRAWINNFAVATVVLNCFSIPLVTLLFKHHEGIRRLMHLVVDMYLDFACAVIVPMCVLAPYMLAFNWSTNKYSTSLIHDDVWFSNAVGEARQVLVTTYLDFFASLLPQYSIFSCLRLLKRLLRRRPPRRPTRRRGIVAPSSRLSKPSVQEMQVASTDPNDSPSATTESRGVHFVSGCVMAWAVVVLTLHFTATSRTETFPGCQLFVRPWLATNVSCSVLYAHCHRLGIDGSAEELAVVLDQVERTVLTKVVFIRCPALQIPSNLLQFPNLQGVEIGGSTLVDWPVEAAIRQSLHPSMGSVYIIQSNLSEIPSGLLHSDLPQSLNGMIFLNCSLAELPENLGDIWATSGIRRLGFEFTRVRKIPSSVGRLQLHYLWMPSNLIESFPDGMFANSQLLSIYLSGNPLLRLPSTMGDISLLEDLIMEHTNVTTIPSWAKSWLASHSTQVATGRVSFFGSPVCDPSASPPEIQDTGRLCSQDLQSRYGSIPYDLIKDKYRE